MFPWKPEDDSVQCKNYYGSIVEVENAQNFYSLLVNHWSFNCFNIPHLVCGGSAAASIRLRLAPPYVHFPFNPRPVVSANPFNILPTDRPPHPPPSPPHDRPSSYYVCMCSPLSHPPIVHSIFHSIRAAE